MLLGFLLPEAVSDARLDWHPGGLPTYAGGQAEVFVTWAAIIPGAAISAPGATPATDSGGHGDGWAEFQAWYADQDLWAKLSENSEESRAAALAGDTDEVIRLIGEKDALLDSRLQFLGDNPPEDCYSVAHDGATRLMAAESAATKALMEGAEASFEGDRSVAIARFQKGEELAAEAVRLQDQLPAHMAEAEQACQGDE